MLNHPDYERIDEFGEVIVDEKDTAENQIPLQIASMGARKSARRLSCPAMTTPSACSDK
jgi:hypothetical protein